MNNVIQRALTGLVLVMAVAGMWWYLSPLYIGLLLLGLMLYTVLVEWPRFQCWWLTPLYPVIPFLLLICYAVTPLYREFLWLLGMTVTHDSVAYVTGNLIGRHKLMPTVSPGKTWEGVIGGTCGAIVVGWVMLHTLFSSMSCTPLLCFLLKSPRALIGVLMLLNVAAVSGDLFESWLKRRAHLKDSGALFPGHGGVLDRLDSLFGILIAWSLLHFFIGLFILT